MSDAENAKTRTRAVGGTGALLSGDREVPVRYDLVEAQGGRVFAAGAVFGDAEALCGVFGAGPCILRLETGQPVHAYLEDCRASAGVADIRITDPIDWT